MRLVRPLASRLRMRTLRLFVIPLLIMSVSGCGTYVHRSRLEDCARLTRDLRTEVLAQKDQVVRMRTALDDSRLRDRERLARVTEIEERNRILEARLDEYRRDRELMAETMRQFQEQLQSDTVADNWPRTNDPGY